LLPWKGRGYECVALNPKTPARFCSGISMRTVTMGTIDAIRSALPPADEIAFLICVPPARDLCHAGARWWSKKALRDPQFQLKAVQFIVGLHRLLRELTHVPSIILLPASARIKTLYKAPDFTFSPHQFAGYLPSHAHHPVFPATIPTQDRYTKKTFVYTTNAVVCPCMRPLPPVFTEVRSKRGITKRITPLLASRKHREARCVVPLGFASAICSVNAAWSVADS